MNVERSNMPSCVEKYKLTWLDPLDANYIYSKFFASQVDMVYHIQDLDPKYDYMAWEFNYYDQRGYVWELMPYGSYKSYKYGMIISEYIVAILISILILYFILK
tara:strand:+ start:2549 stop:2860 length:312 start_codon:yes stop_codon:yes gene_type:complete